MDRLTVFIANNPVLVGVFVALIVALVVTEIRRTRRGWREVSPAELTRMINSEDALVVDLNPPGDFEKGHITGARNHAFAQFDPAHKELAAARERPIAVYCKDGYKSAEIAGRLVQAGFAKVAILRGGLQTWQQDNLPVQKGRR
jgi:rhodanese-related sulfurtransferase